MLGEDRALIGTIMKREFIGISKLLDCFCASPLLPESKSPLVNSHRGDSILVTVAFSQSMR